MIRIMQNEKANWEDGHVFVTDKVQWIMKNVVKKARKNYFGIFNQQKDPVTGRDKVFIPLTEWTVETMLKNIDIDTKNIEVKARHPRAYLKAQVFRHILRKKLNDIGFGKILNQWLRRAAIDGTAYLKALEEDGKLAVRVVDRLNMITDPSVECLYDSAGRTERHVMTKPEFDQLELDNAEYVDGSKTIDRVNIDTVSALQTPNEVPFVEVYERHGYWPEFVRTGDDADRNKYFFGRAVVSGLASKVPVVHLVEALKESEDPYGEGKLKEVPNRHDGRGIGEMLFNIQAYLNEIVNSRMNKARVAQLGLFKMTGNVTPQQFKRLFTTGGIKLDQASDISVLDTGTVDPSSYKDEEQAYTWGTRVTGTTNEDEVQSNRPATNALIEQQGASKGYNLRIEDLMLNLAEFIQEKVLPIIKKELKAKRGELERITGDPDILRKLDEAFVRNKVYENINALSPTEKEMLAETGLDIETIVQQGVENMKSMGEDRFIPILDDLFDTDYDVEIVITDESINRSVMANMLQQTLGILAPLGLPVKNTLRELYDVMGLDGENLVQDMPAIPPMAQGQTPDQAAVGPGGMANSVPQPSDAVPV